MNLIKIYSIHIIIIMNYLEIIFYCTLSASIIGSLFFLYMKNNPKKYNKKQLSQIKVILGIIITALSAEFVIYGYTLNTRFAQNSFFKTKNPFFRVSCIIILIMLICVFYGLFYYYSGIYRPDIEDLIIKINLGWNILTLGYMMWQKYIKFTDMRIEHIRQLKLHSRPPPPSPPPPPAMDYIIPFDNDKDQAEYNEKKQLDDEYTSKIYNANTYNVTDDPIDNDSVYDDEDIDVLTQGYDLLQNKKQNEQLQYPIGI